MVVKRHLVVVNVEKESTPLRQVKNGLRKDRYKTCSRTHKKNGSREANLTQPPTLVSSGRKQSPSGWLGRWMDAAGILWRVPLASPTLPESSALSVEANSDSLSAGSRSGRQMVRLNLPNA